MNVVFFATSRVSGLASIVTAIKFSKIFTWDSIRLILVKWSNGVLLPEHSGWKESKANGSS